MFTRELPGVSLEQPAQSQDSRIGEPGLGVCFCGVGTETTESLYPSPSPTAISGYGGGIIWCETQLFTPLLFCYVLLPTPPISCSCLLTWVPLALETQAELAGGLTSLDVWNLCQPQ